MLSNARKDEDSDIDGGESNVAKEVEREKKVARRVGRVPLHHTIEVGNMMTEILNRKSNHLNICEQAVHI